MVISTGTEIGGLLVDGLGDGVLVEYPQEDLSFLRVMSFGLLQARSPRARSAPALAHTTPVTADRHRDEEAPIERPAEFFKPELPENFEGPCDLRIHAHDGMKRKLLCQVRIFTFCW